MSKKQRFVSTFGFYLTLVLGVAILFAYKKGVFEDLKKVKLQKKVEKVQSVTEIKLEDGFTLVPVTGPAKVSLINMSGDEVHSWPVDAMRARLLKNGNLLVIHGSKWGIKNEPWRSLRNTVREYDWSGEIVWEYETPDIAHHDIQQLENGNLLFPYRVMLPQDAKTSIIDKMRRRLKIRSDSIIEVNRRKEIVWQWNAHEFLDLNSCGQRKCSVHTGSDTAQSRMSDWTHINTTTIIPENKFYDAGDERFKPGNIIILPRNFWMVFIIDKDTKEVVWEYKGNYRGGLSGGHEAHMIPKGFPGAGNVLVFDNGRVKHKGESFILEIDPQTKELVWVYDNGKKFFSNSAGSMQRFANGNTLISEDLDGHIFEVTPDKEIVWEFKTDYRISRARRYRKDYCPQFNSLSLY